jgi:hypothetical protein
MADIAGQFLQQREEAEVLWDGWNEDNETDDRWMFRIDVLEGQDTWEEEDPTYGGLMLEPRYWFIRNWLDTGEC